MEESVVSAVRTIFMWARKLDKRGVLWPIITILAVPVVGWLCGANFWQPLGNLLSKPGASGWVQAFGSIAAILVAIRLAHSDTRERKAVRKQEVASFAIRILPDLNKINEYVDSIDIHKIKSDKFETVFHEYDKIQVTKVSSVNEYGTFSALSFCDSTNIIRILSAMKLIRDYVNILNNEVQKFDVEKKNKYINSINKNFEEVSSLIGPAIKRMEILKKSG